MNPTIKHNQKNNEGNKIKDRVVSFRLTSHAFQTIMHTPDKDSKDVSSSVFRKHVSKQVTHFACSIKMGDGSQFLHAI
jgi:hypothetical protein